ncbi:MAG: hypothetical protein QXI39_00915 [Candidatus Bathyarchaeia archaeon]
MENKNNIVLRFRGIDPSFSEKPSLLKKSLVFMDSTPYGSFTLRIERLLITLFDEESPDEKTFMVGLPIRVE